MHVSVDSVAWQESEGMDAQDIAFQHIRKSIQDVQNLTRYQGLRAALNMLTLQVSAVQSQHCCCCCCYCCLSSLLSSASACAAGWQRVHCSAAAAVAVDLISAVHIKHVLAWTQLCSYLNAVQVWSVMMPVLAANILTVTNCTTACLHCNCCRR